MFAFAARKPGKVISKKSTGIVIEYEDGTRKGIELGRRFGSAAGLTIAHEVISNLKEGDSFKAGDIISYNEVHFETDLINPKNVVLKSGVLANVVLYEGTETHEDASSISKSLASQLTTKITKVKTIVVNFDQIIKNLVKPGQEVTHESILCVIEDAVTSNANLFDEVSLNTLRILSNQTPTAKVNGVVERVEVYYHGDLEDMSDSLRALALASDKELAVRFRSQGKTAYTGSVNGDFRNEGEPLGVDCVAVKIYITSEVSMAVGDKGVFANQMKTVVSKVIQNEITTENGIVVDAVFGGKSINARIVNNPVDIGTTNVLLEIIGRKAYEIYKGISK